MATRNQYAQILTIIKTAPHSVSGVDIERQMAMNEEDFDSAIDALLASGHIKEDADNDDHYFTRKPKRDEIDAFRANPATGTLTGITFDPEPRAITSATPPAPAITPFEIDEATGFRVILTLLRTSAHAVPESKLAELRYTNLEDLLDTLLHNNIIKADVNTGAYFTRKPMRERVDKFIATWDLNDLFPETEASDDEPSIDINELFCEDCTNYDLNEKYLNAIAMVRDLADVILTRSGR